MEVTRSEQENDRNHLACPKCKSTGRDFKRTSQHDVEVVSAAYSWKCKKCRHEFEITIRNYSR